MPSRSSFCVIPMVLAVALGGCSLMLIDKPEKDIPVSKAPRCSTGAGPIVTDVLFSLIYGAVGLSVVDEDGGEGAGVLALALAAVHGASAAGGRSWTNRCREQFEAHDEYLASNELLPGSRAGSDPNLDFDIEPDPEPSLSREPESEPEPSPEPSPEPEPEPEPEPDPPPARRPTHECVGARCLPAFWREVTP